MSKDYRVEVRVRNGKLYAAMRAAGYETAAELSRASGVTQTALGNLLNLKTPWRLSRTGEWRLDVLKISETLRALPEDLVPARHEGEALPANRAHIDLDEADMARLIAGAHRAPGLLPDATIEKEEARETFEAILREALTDRQFEVLARRFGLFDTNPQTLEEIGQHFCVSRESVRQIEASAMRKLKHPRHKDIRNALATITGMRP